MSKRHANINKQHNNRQTKHKINLKTKTKHIIKLYTLYIL